MADRLRVLVPDLVRRSMALPAGWSSWFRGRTAARGVLSFIVSLLLILLLLLLASFIVMRSFRVERQSLERSNHAAGVVERLDNIKMLALDIETGARGYLVTRERSYLAPLRMAEERYQPALDDLATYTSRSAAAPERRWQRVIARLMHDHVRDADTVVALMRAGNRDDAVAFIRTGAPKQRMDALRVLLSDYVGFEDTQLAVERARANHYQAQGSAVLQLIALLMLILLGLIAYLTWRNIRSLKTEAELIEITEAKEQIELISRELNHRVKNLFAIVMAIITMTARRETDAQKAAQKARERVAALAAAHDLTVGRAGDQGVNLSALIDTVLAPYATETQRFMVAGPAIVLPTRMATPVGLALHELATNAVKYGAWSTEHGGTIEVRWTVAPVRDDAVCVTVTWQERGGPPVNPPEQAASGFGSVMIQQGMRQIAGRYAVEWHASGVVASMAFDVPQ